jgi:hypothetical protein
MSSMISWDFLGLGWLMSRNSSNVFPFHNRMGRRADAHTYLLIPPVFAEDVGWVEVSRYELEVDGVGCHCFAGVVVGQGVVSLLER